MSTDSRIEELLARWQELQQKGQEISLEALCQEAPELVPQVQQAVEQLEQMEESLDSKDDKPAGSLSSEDTLPPANTAPPARVFGRYRLHRLLGAGGMGSVHLARDTQLHRWVALKIPKLEGVDAQATRARFLREAQSTAALNHPNICPIHDLGEVEGTPYLTMPFLEGQSLAERLAAEGPLPIGEAVEIVHKVAMALQVAHDQGVIHRDLKPDNIFMDNRSEPVLMDFGLARRADMSGSQITLAGQIMGTPAYMPPEQFEGNSQGMGPYCDIYSLGVVLYELLTGRCPFEGDLVALMGQAMVAEPEPPSKKRNDLPPKLETVCLKALAKKPGDRWASMKDFAEALKPFLPTEQLTEPLGSGGEARLMLRIKDTPYLYRPRPGQKVISVGRQRRKLGAPSDQGCDFVVRVSGSAQLSTRISRLHFEIRETEEGGYVVVDLSRHGLLLNGNAVTKNEPTAIKGGDILMVAEVLELEVLMQVESGAEAIAQMVQVPAAGGSSTSEQVEMEASLGDLLTMG